MATSAVSPTRTAVSPGRKPISSKSSKGWPEDEPQEVRRRALYGRAVGRPLRKQQAEAMRDRLPDLALDLGTLRGGSVFAPETPLWLEIGFGGGEHLLARARENPDVGLIGSEPFVNGVAKTVAALDAERIENVRIWADDALALLAAAPDGAFSRIYLLYPDPWPKRRQNKRRLIQEETISAMARVLLPKGEVRFATDIDDYAGWTLRRFLAAGEFGWVASRADDWRSPWEGWSPTRYERKARQAGRGSAYLTFERR